MRNKPKIAYLMHVDWNWIKQRPHFLYEELSQYYDVGLFYIHKLYDRYNISNPRSVQIYSRSNTLIKLPLSGRFRFLQKIEKLINMKSIRSIKRYDHIWITSPLVLEFVPQSVLEEKVIIYDCMDDFLGFYTGMNGIDRLRKLESNLVRRANFIFTSSSYLKDKLVLSYQEDLKITPVVINNGISPSLLSQEVPGTIEKPNLDNQNGLLNLMYFGTVAKWVDFELIMKVLQLRANVKFTIIGPIETKIPVHPRIEFIGPIEHEKLKKYAAFADAFIMPFKLNELIRSVDPVKIYEYICFGKPIFSINYREMDKFLPFVNLYTNEDELLNLIENLQNGKLEMYSEADALSFLNQSTWKVRCEQIVRVLAEGSEIFQ